MANEKQQEDRGAPPDAAPAVGGLSEKEKRLVKRLVQKYSRDGSPLLRSLAIFTAMVLIGHAVEQRPELPGWAAFLIIYVPALWLFSKYRRFSIFKSNLLCKLAAQSGILDAPGGDSAQAAGGPKGASHAPRTE